MNGGLTALEGQYLTLKRNLSAVLTACGEDEASKDQARRAYEQARDNYWRTLNHTFDENDPTVSALTSELNSKQQELEEAIEHLEDVAKVLQIIAGAVSIGTRLAALVPV